MKLTHYQSNEGETQMADHCYSRWSIDGSDVDEKTMDLVEEILTSEHYGSFTFNGLVPMPEILTKIERGGITIDGEDLSHYVQEYGEPRALTREEDQRADDPSDPVFVRVHTGSRKIGGIWLDRWMQDRKPVRKMTPEEDAARLGTGSSDWCAWREKHWGTKWDAQESEMERFAETMEIRFWTPGGPPRPVAEAFRRRFPQVDLHAEYEDEPVTY